MAMRKTTGKVIDLWTYEDKVACKTVEYEIRLHEKKREFDKPATYWFSADASDTYKFFRKDYQFTADDLNVLQRDVDAAVATLHANAWTRKIRIYTYSEPEAGENSVSGDLKIRYELWDCATDAQGRPLYRYSGKTFEGLRAISFGDLKNESSDTKGRKVAILDWTQEREDRLKSIIASLEALGQRVLAMMCDDRIALTLETMNLLPAPEKKS
jgi:hypothetical protein